MRNTVLLGDVVERLRELPDDSIDAIVTDPPYGLEFMGKEWDGWSSPAAFGEWCRQWAVEALRVLKPGGHLLAFGGTRMYHRLATGIEDAGFEIRDTIVWLYGSGFPKSLDVSKAIDKAAGAEREVVGSKIGFPGYRLSGHNGGEAFGHGLSSSSSETRLAASTITAPATDAAHTWSGFGTALKPAHEPIVVARKPLIGTVAQNVQTHGTGALNIDGCRVAHDEECRLMPPSQANIDNPSEKHRQARRRTEVLELKPEGRWPANVAHDGSVEVLELFPESNGMGRAILRRGATTGRGIGYHSTSTTQEVEAGYGDSGSAARFFYCAKASRADREAGLTVLPERVVSVWGGDDDDLSPGKSSTIARRNDHPTVKPHDLMRWLVRLVGGQPGSLILDPFAGSGSTLRAARAEGFDFLGIERDRHYYRLACLRAGLPDPGEGDEEMC